MPNCYALTNHSRILKIQWPQCLPSLALILDAHRQSGGPSTSPTSEQQTTGAEPPRWSCFPHDRNPFHWLLANEINEPGQRAIPVSEATMELAPGVCGCMAEEGSRHTVPGPPVTNPARRFHEIFPDLPVEPPRPSSNAGGNELKRKPLRLGSRWLGRTAALAGVVATMADEGGARFIPRSRPTI